MSWREARVAAAEADAERLTDFLVELDDVEQLVSDDERLCIELRSVAARIRTRVSSCRDEAGRLDVVDHVERAAG